MTRMLYRLGGAAAAHPWRTLGIWLVVVAIATGLAGVAGGTPQDDWNVPGTASQAGTDLLREEFPAASGAVDRVVVHDRVREPGGDRRDRPADRAADRPAARARGVPAPSLRRRRHGPDPGPLRRAGHRRGHLRRPRPRSRRRPTPAVDAGLQVAFGGEVPDSASLAPGGTGEVVGVVVALLLLVLTFGSVVAAGLPILVALLGLGVGSAGVLLLAAVMDVSTSAPTVATMVCLGVGIDYALLLVTRHVEACERAATSGTRPRTRRPPPAARSSSPAAPCSSRSSGSGWPGCRPTPPSASPPRSAWSA